MARDRHAVLLGKPSVAEQGAEAIQHCLSALISAQRMRNKEQLKDKSD